MAEDQYRIVLTGYSTSKGEYYIEEDFAKLFKISLERAKEMFQTSPTLIKHDLSLDQANKYKNSIEKTGAICEIESMKYNFSGLSLE
ncbi:MAG: ribosomal protein L7/L12 [Proteobacteria bacterium]|nr:ribosomal protein L7/L12 [Pseudomonadota bacterium]